ncbi:ABC transporter permease [bacterium]|nr:ABC transporter permease [bacterium]
MGGQFPESVYQALPTVLRRKPAAVKELTKIKPQKGLIGVNLKELYRYRELLFTLTMRDIKVRYKQTVIGGIWAVLQPFLTMVVFTLFFGKVVKIPSEGIPYALFSYSGLLLWTYFANSVTKASNSLISNTNLISKIYFPRLLIPLSSTMVGLLDYLIAFILVFGMMIYYRFLPPLTILLVPVILFFTWMFAAGLSFWLSAINVKYRDVRYVVPFFVQLLLFMTPVIYPVSIAGKYRWLLMLNPMTGFIEAHRAMLIGHQPINYGMVGISISITVALFIGGLVYFRSVERYFADII